MAWKELESQGWIAKVTCEEVRVHLSEGDRDLYGSLWREAEIPDCR